MLKLFDARYEKGSVDIFLLFLNMLIHLIEDKIITSGKFAYYDILNKVTMTKNQLLREYTLNRKLLLLKMFISIQQFESK